MIGRSHQKDTQSPVKVLILLSFNSPLGGLHEHALAQARAVKNGGGETAFYVTNGIFADRLEAQGYEVFRDTGGTPAEEAKRLFEEIGDKPDIIHTHPFRACKVAVAFKALTNASLVLTIHSLYDAGLKDFASDVDRVITVSDAARDLLVSRQLLPPEKIVTIFNGVDMESYSQLDNPDKYLAAKFVDFPQSLPATYKKALVVSRLEKDKAFITNLLKEIWRLQAEQGTHDIFWIIAGDGTGRAELEDLARTIESEVEQRRFLFTGWLNETADLRAVYSWADAAIAPGRCALEAMACGTPAIAVGSKGYVGTVPGYGEALGKYTNFGGIDRLKMQPPEVLNDLESLLYEGQKASMRRTRAREFADTHFSQAKLDRILLDTYANLIQERSALAVTFGHQGAVPLHLSSRIWTVIGDTQKAEVTTSPDGSATIKSDLQSEEKLYLTMNKGAFLKMGESHAFQDCSKIPSIEFQATLEGNPIHEALDLFFMFYRKSGERMAVERRTLHAGENRLRFRTPEGAARFVLAFRIAGKGHSRIVEPQLVLPSYPKHRAADAESKLIFVLGPPRSGTSWLWNMLRLHPDVIAASEDNLGIRKKERETLETNIFNPALKLSIAQMRERFKRLHQQFPDKFIIEKTPVHLLHLDRMLETFPGAHFVKIKRDPRANVSSLLKVGRDRNAWWKNAPAEIDDAVTFFRPYFKSSWFAARTVEGLIEISYERLFQNPQAELKALLEKLSLDISPLEKLIEDTVKGGRLPIDGVFRGGEVDAWKHELTQEEVHKVEAVFCGREAEAFGPKSPAP